MNASAAAAATFQQLHFDYTVSRIKTHNAQQMHHKSKRSAGTAHMSLTKSQATATSAAVELSQNRTKTTVEQTSEETTDEHRAKKIWWKQLLISQSLIARQQPMGSR